MKDKVENCFFMQKSIVVLLFFNIFLFSQENPSISSLETQVLDEIEIQSQENAFSPLVFSTEILEKQSIHKDFGAVLGQLPGVNFNTDAGNPVGNVQLRVRGTAQKYLNIYFNNILLNDAETNMVYFVNTPDLLASTSQIALQKGVTPEGQTQGFGFGSHLFLFSEISENFSVENQNIYGSFNTFKNNIQVNTGVFQDYWRAQFRISRVSSEGYRENSGAELYGYFSALTYQKERQKWDFLFFGGKEHTQVAWDGLTKDQMLKNPKYNPTAYWTDEDGNSHLYRNTADNYQQHYVQIFHTYTLEKHQFQQRFHYTYGGGYWQQVQLKSFADLGLHQVENPEKLTTGVHQEWLQNHIAGLQSVWNYQHQGFSNSLRLGISVYTGHYFSDLIHPISNDEVIFPWRYVDGDATKINNFLQNVSEYQWKNLHFYLALQYRFVYYESHGNRFVASNIYDFKDQLHFINPITGLKYQINPNQNIYLYYGFLQQEPSREDYLENLETQPKPEYLHNLEFGYQWYKAGFILRLNTFGMYYINQFTLTGALDAQKNPIRAQIGKGYRTGVEFTFQLPIVHFFHLNGDFNYMYSRNIDFLIWDEIETWKKQNTPMSYAPEFWGQLSMFFYPVKNYSFHFNVRFTDAQYLSNEKKYILPAYYTLNFGTDYCLKINKGLKSILFSLSIDNLTNLKYSSSGYVQAGEIYYFPQAGLQFYGGIHLKF